MRLCLEWYSRPEVIRPMATPRQRDEACSRLRSAAQGTSKSQTARSSLEVCSIFSASRRLKAAQTLMPKLSITLLTILSDASSGARSRAEKTFHGENSFVRLDVKLRAKLPELMNSPERTFRTRD